LRAEQHRYDDEARAVASWASALGADRVAWPEELRQAVPALLDADVQPVLVDSGVPTQSFAINRTSVVVTRGSTTRAVSVVERDRQAFGTLTAHLVDLEAAAREPLPVGAVATVEIARPFVYAPLRASLPVGARPFTATVTLQPGRYRFEADVFSPAGGQGRLRAESGRTVLRERTVTLGPLVEAPTALEFELAPSHGTSVRLTVTASPGPDSNAFMHAWRIHYIAAG
jgi:hypothetical protein